MKKTFVILTIVLAILAAPVFAEVTASGEVNYAWGFNGDDYSETIDSNDMTIDLGGTVGEFTSIKAEFEGEYGDSDGDLNNGAPNDADGSVNLNSATLTQDITGALGLDTPVSVSVTFGLDSVGGDPVNYNEVAGYNFASDGELDPGTLMTKVSFGIDTMTVDATVWQDNFAVEAYGKVADMADVSVYYYNEATAGWKAAPAAFTPVDPFVFGINAAASVMEGLTVGAGMEYAGFEKIGDVESLTSYGISASYTMDALTAGVSMASYTYKDSPDFMEATEAALNVTYSLNEMFDVFAAVKSVLDAGTQDFSDVVCYEAGAMAAVDGVTYTAGYTLGSDWNAYDAGMMDGADRAGNFFVKVGASF